jgi:hypothetical protein
VGVKASGGIGVVNIGIGTRKDVGVDRGNVAVASSETSTAIEKESDKTAATAANINNR